MPFMKPYMVKLLREQFPPGTRVRLDSMMNDPQPIPKGMTGTVQGIDDAGQLLMKWDNVPYVLKCIILVMNRNQLCKVLSPKSSKTEQIALFRCA